MSPKRVLVIAAAEVVIVFAALIRTLTSYYLLPVLPGDVLPVEQVRLIVVGSVVAALCCFGLGVLFLLRRYRVLHLGFGLSIAALVLVKILTG